MFQVVVLPPPGSMRNVEEFRRTHDPAFHRIPAHIPLVPPFDSSSPAFVERFDAYRGRGAFDVAFGAPSALGHALCLPVTTGHAEIVALRAELVALVGGPLAEVPHAPPALRTGLFSGDAELELARRVLSTLPHPEPFVAREIALVLEDVRGLWHTVRERRLLPGRD